jgi:hypothetical protein
MRASWNIDEVNCSSSGYLYPTIEQDLQMRQSRLSRDKTKRNEDSSDVEKNGRSQLDELGQSGRITKTPQKSNEPSGLQGIPAVQLSSSTQTRQGVVDSTPKIDHKQNEPKKQEEKADIVGNVSIQNQANPKKTEPVKDLKTEEIAKEKIQASDKEKDNSKNNKSEMQAGVEHKPQDAKPKDGQKNTQNEVAQKDSSQHKPPDANSKDEKPHDHNTGGTSKNQLFIVEGFHKMDESHAGMISLTS